jgi:uncharacterized repeat protein (TIGR01451 family)
LATNVSNDRGSCNRTFLVTCAVDTLKPGARATITATVLVDAAVLPGTYTNQANITDATTADPDGSNDTASVPIAVTGLADVQVAKVASPNPIDPDQPVTYRIAVVNRGPSSARGVTVVDQLPVPPLEFTSVTSTRGTCDSVGATLTCDVGDLRPGGAPVLIVVEMNVPAGFTGDDVTNVASATTSTADSDTANNTATFVSSSDP